MAITSPTAPAITAVTLAGSTLHQSNFWYGLRAIYPDGSKVPSDLFFQTGLSIRPSYPPDPNHYGNNVIVWNSIAGVTSYEVYRCWSNSALNQTDLGLIGTTAGNTFTDYGQMSDYSLSANEYGPIVGPPSQAKSTGLFTDTQTIDDSIGLVTGGVYNETQPITDNTLTKSVSKTFEDTTFLTDSIQANNNTGIGDTESLIDNTITKDVSKPFNDVPDLEESLTLAVSKPLNDSPSFMDAITFSLSAPKVDNIVLGDWISIKLIRQNQWGL